VGSFATLRACTERSECDDIRRQSQLVILNEVKNPVPMHEKLYCVYIASNQRNTVLYTGMTSALPERMTQHKQKVVPGFTKKYNIDKLVYFEVFETAYDAIAREKKIKGWTRKKKDALIDSNNPTRRDLSDDL